MHDALGPHDAASPPIDLDAYLGRIGHSGARDPSLATLAAVHRRHAESIAFENLSPLTGEPVRLDPGSIEAKLVRGGRGGYCFEHNLLLRHALTDLGFGVTCLAARVLWNRPEDAVTARGHMLLLVDLPEGRHVADVGFGGMTLTGPLRLDTEEAQVTPHERFRILSGARGFTMQAEVAGQWRTLYRFDLQPQVQVDYEVTSWYLSNHPESHFVTGLVAARPAGDRRYALRGVEFAVHHLGGASEHRVLGTVAEIRQVLEGPFQLTLPPGPALDRALDRLLAARRAAP
jgi:N-hydroxyarylamine O-acetyltransferase